MAEAFEWPNDGGNSWESQDPVTTVIEASEASTESQVDVFLERFSGDGKGLSLHTQDYTSLHRPLPGWGQNDAPQRDIFRL